MEIVVVNQKGETVTLSKSDWEKIVKTLGTGRMQARTPNKTNTPKKMKRPYKKRKPKTTTE